MGSVSVALVSVAGKVRENSQDNCNSIPLVNHKKLGLMCFVLLTNIFFREIILNPPVIRPIFILPTRGLKRNTLLT